MSASRHPGSRSSLVLAIALIALALGSATLTGCGQKGQLYLPNQKKSKVPPTQQPPGTPQPATPPPATPQPATPPPGTTPAPASSPAPS
jgi:predicted small lipoprotein YifL